MKSSKKYYKLIKPPELASKQRNICSSPSNQSCG